MDDRRKLWMRVLVSVAVPVAAWAAGYVTLPGVNGSVMAMILRWGRSAPSLLGLFNLPGPTPEVSIVAIGLMPAISAYTLVEIAAAIVPRWRPLRVGGAEGRASLRWSAAAVTVVLALIQGFFIARWLEASSHYRMFGELVSSPGLAWELLTAVTLAAGACLLLAATWLIDRRGFGSGFAVLLGAAYVPELCSLALRAFFQIDNGMISFADVISLLARTGGIGLGAWWLLTAHVRVPGALRHPTSGALPVGLAASLLLLPVQLGWLGLDLRELSLAPGTRAYETALGVAIAGFTVALSWAFYKEARGTRALWQAIGRTGAVLIAAALLSGRGALALDVTMPIVLTALVMDLRAEWRMRVKHGELVSVRPVHQLAHLDAYVARLAAAGVPVLPRAENYRALLWFFGPFIPVELMVPASRAEEAASAIAEA
jgi:hypothetical protein